MRSITHSNLLLGLYGPILTTIGFLIFLIFGTNLGVANSWWTRYIAENQLVPYVDFRPGYPPLGGGLYIIVDGYLRLPPVIFVAVQAVSFGVILFYLAKILSTLGEVAPWKRIFPLMLLPGLAVGVLYTNDVFSSLSMTLTFYFLVRNRPFLAGVATSVGFLTKIYPALMAVPVLIALAKASKSQARPFFLGLVLTAMIGITPFVALEPFMFTSTFVHHTLRGPADTLFAIAEGYYGHTGFLHPTFEAALYYWDFRALYPGSQLDHFAYSWNFQFIPYVLLFGQFLILTLPFVVWDSSSLRRWPTVAASMLGVFGLSSVYVPQFEVALAPLIVLSTSSLRRRYALSSLLLFDFATMLDWTVWGFFFVSLADLRTLLFILQVVLRTAILVLISVPMLLGFGRQNTTGIR